MFKYLRRERACDKLIICINRINPFIFAKFKYTQNLSEKNCKFRIIL